MLTFNGYYEWKVEGDNKQPFVFLPAGTATSTKTKDDCVVDESEECKDAAQ